MRILTNYIYGQQRVPLAGQYLDNYEPATGQVYGQIPDSDAQDVALAAEAAKRAFPAWRGLPAVERSRYLNKIADAIEARLDELAEAESLDNGKPVSLARRVDIPRAVANFRFFATAILHTSGESFETDDEAVNHTLRQPLGVVTCISPWNLPLYLFTWKIAPALAVGNTVLAKPSEITPLTACILGEICQQVGLPAGVLNILHGRGAGIGEALVTHTDVKAISFTGGTATGARISALAAPKFKKLSLELGGKNAALIFADCNYTSMLDSIVASTLNNQGQICLCTSRLLIERSIYERFKADYLARVNALVVGDPKDGTTNQGALVSAAHLTKQLHYIELAKAEGGIILAGGHRVEVGGRCKEGWFLAPTVIEGLGPMATCNREEIFGPVVTLQVFDTEDEAFELANATDYGLATVVWSEHASRVQRLSSALQAGIVWVNCWMLRDLRTPFGGVKQSGIGREGGNEALRFFTEVKNVCQKRYE
jgi:aminomuconate-semialdehyde/2-hydroxymuconate-6-semialdehyde dehydrogenase